MIKALTNFFIIVFLFFITIPSNSYSQDKKDVTSQKVQQSEIVTDSDQYVIGTEDMIYIYVWKEEALSRTVPVRIDGKISLPLVDDIQAAGLTPLQLKKELAKKLSKFIDNPSVYVTVMAANSYKVYVSGEIKQPGVQLIRSQVSLVKLIIMVGGFTEWADQKKILILRKEKDANKRLIANYKKIIAGEEPDIAINQGDIVIIP